MCVWASRWVSLYICTRMFGFYFTLCLPPGNARWKNEAKKSTEFCLFPWCGTISVDVYVCIMVLILGDKWGGYLLVISFIIGYNKGLLVVVDIFNTTRSVGDICSYMGSVIYSKRVYIWCQDSRRLWLRNNKKEFFFIKLTHF